MTRLTNAIKQEITDKAVDMACAELKAAHEAAEDAAMRAIIQARLDAEVPKKLHSLVTELPSPFTREIRQNDMWVRYPTFVLKDSGESETARVEVQGKAVEPLRIPAEWTNYDWHIDIDVPLKDHPIYAAYKAETDARRAYRTMESETKARVRAVLNATGTVKKLLDAWPESRELIPDDVLNPPKKPMLPAIQTGELNKRIGLPTKKKAA